MCASLAQHHAGAHLRGIPLAHCTFKPPASRHTFSRRAGVCPRCFLERPCAAPSRMCAHMFFVTTFLCATSRHHHTISNRPPAPARPQKCVGVISRSFDALRRPSRVCPCHTCCIVRHRARSTSSRPYNPPYHLQTPALSQYVRGTVMVNSTTSVAHHHRECVCNHVFYRSPPPPIVASLRDRQQCYTLLPTV